MIIVCTEPKSGNLVYIDKGYIIYSLQVPFIKRWTFVFYRPVFKIKYGKRLFHLVKVRKKDFIVPSFPNGMNKP